VSADLVALVLGTALAVGAVGFVLYPLFFEVRSPPPRRAVVTEDSEDSPIVALREIEFDRATGKLSESDYAELKKTYATRALEQMRASDAKAPLDPVEERVRHYRLTHRECSTCGLRPEYDAVYCSNCGAYLDRACPACGSEITETGAVFCSTCGTSLPTSPPALV
jgi:hypothetical protein